jgi:phage-related protein
VANEVDLAIRLTADASDAAAAFDQVGSSAGDMASDVDSASRKADQAAGRLDKVGDSADNLDDKAGRATSSLGALSAGFELAGMEGYATGLQSAAMATDFLSGAGMGLKLIMDLQIVASARAKAATLAHAAAERARSVATKAAAAAQWLMNIAMSANPIGAIIVGVLLLVGGFILLYKRSEKFRAIVQAVMKVATTHIRFVIKVVMELVKWLRDNVPAAWQAVKDKAVAVWSAIRDTVAAVFTGIRDKAATVLSWVRERFAWFRDKLRPITDGIENAIEAAFAPIEWAIDKVQDLIEWIGKIDFPDFPDLNPLGKIGLGRSSASSSNTPAVVNNLNVTIPGLPLVDQAAVAAALQALFDRYGIQLGWRSA